MNVDQEISRLEKLAGKLTKQERELGTTTELKHAQAQELQGVIRTLEIQMADDLCEARISTSAVAVASATEQRLDEARLELASKLTHASALQTRKKEVSKELAQTQQNLEKMRLHATRDKYKARIQVQASIALKAVQDAIRAQQAIYGLVQEAQALQVDSQMLGVSEFFLALDYGSTFSAARRGLNIPIPGGCTDIFIKERTNNN